MFERKEDQVGADNPEDAVAVRVTKKRKRKRSASFSITQTGITTAIVLAGLVMLGGVSQFMIQLAELNEVLELLADHSLLIFREKK